MPLGANEWPVLVALKCMVLVYLNIGFLIAVFTAGMVQRKPQYIAKLMAVQLFLFYVYLCTLASFGREKPTQSYLVSLILVTQGCKNTWSLHLPLLGRHEITMSTRVPPVLINHDMFKCQATGIKGSKVCHGRCLLT